MPARPDGARATRPRRTRVARVARVAAVALATVGLLAAIVARRDELAVSVSLLGRLDWTWIAVAVALESASMGAFSGLQRRLLLAGGVRVTARPMLATTYAANALSVSVPLAGAELGTAFTFRRFTRQGADAPLASWSLVVGGVISAAAAGLVLAAGGLASGNLLLAVTGVAGGVLTAAAVLVVAVAARQPRLRRALEPPAARALRHGRRLLHRPASDPGRAVRVIGDRLGALRLAPAGWLAVTTLALVNLLADAAVLAVSIHAVGAPVPWHLLLVAYGAGVAGQSLNITPGGLGVTEGALCAALVTAGLRASQSLAAVLLFRLVSFWLVAAAGWLVWLWLRRRPAPRGAASAATAVLRTAGVIPGGAVIAQPAGTAIARPAGTAIAQPAGTAIAQAGGTVIAQPVGTAIAQAAGRLRHRHTLVLLHGQPGLPADWHQVTARLPAQLHAIAVDRPGYGASQQPAGGFTAGARAVLGELDARGIQRAVLVGHSYGGGVALAAAGLAPHRVEAVVLLASVGPGCLNRWDRLLAAPGTGPLCALVVWRLTPWIARAWLAGLTRRAGTAGSPAGHASLEVWAHASSQHSALWRTFLTEQRALVRELGELVASVPAVRAPVLLLTDPRDTLVPAATARRLARDLPDARLLLVEGAGHHLPRRAAGVVASAIVAFLSALESAGNAARPGLHAVTHEATDGSAGPAGQPPAAGLAPGNRAAADGAVHAGSRHQCRCRARRPRARPAHRRQRRGPDHDPAGDLLRRAGRADPAPVAPDRAGTAAGGGAGRRGGGPGAARAGWLGLGVRRAERPGPQRWRGQQRPDAEPGEALLPGPHWPDDGPVHDGTGHWHHARGRPHRSGRRPGWRLADRPRFLGPGQCGRGPAVAARPAAWSA